MLENFLSPIRKKREEFAKDPHEVMNILKKGTMHAKDVAHKTLEDVRSAIGINYF